MLERAGTLSVCSSPEGIGLSNDRPLSSPLHRMGRTGRAWLLATPGIVFFLIFFAVPLTGLFLISFDKPTAGIVDVQWMFQLDNFIRFFTRSLCYEAAIRSAGLAALVSTITLFLGYPLAFVIAKTLNPGRNTLLMILVLCAMQLDMVIRLFGLLVLIGENFLINDFLR